MISRSHLLHAEVTRAIIGSFFEVYNALGFGLLESAYAAAIQRELRRRGHVVRREQWIDVLYKGEAVARQRVDMIVDDRVVVEIKATELLPRFAKRQLLSYLTVTALEVGVLLHFGPEAKFYRMISTMHRQSSA